MVSQIDQFSTTVRSLSGFSEPSSIDYDGINAWVTNRASNTVIEVKNASTATPAVGVTVTVGHNPEQIVFDTSKGKMWVSNRPDDTLSFFDPTQISPTATTVPAGGSPFALSSDGVGHIWATLLDSNSVAEFDATTGAGIGSLVPSGGDTPVGITSDGYHVWVSDYGSNQVEKFAINNPSGNVRLIPGFSQPYGLDFASDTDTVWVANFGNGRVVTTP
jgi:DNA-binding beta-propeller fold protein YncE